LLGEKETLKQPFPLYLNNAGFLLDKGQEQSVGDIAKSQFHPFSSYFSTVPDHLPVNKNWWMKVEIQSSYSSDTTIIFYPGFQNYVTIYHAEGGRFTKIPGCGNLISSSRLSIPEIRQAAYLPISAGQLNVFYICVKNKITYHTDAFRPYLMSTASLDNLQVKSLSGYRIPEYIFFTGIGMFLIMFIYILIKWVYQKDITYLFYAIAIFCSTAYFFFNFLKERNNQFVFSERPLLVHLVSDTFIFLSMFAYWQFVRKFLYVDKENNFLSKYLKYGSYIILLLGTLSFLYAVIFQNITSLIQLNTIIGMIQLVAGVYVLFGIRKVNQPLRRFIYGGILCILIFYSLGSIYEFVRDTRFAFLPGLGGGTPLLMMGNVFEMLFFTIGLAYRSKLEAEAVANIGIQKTEAEMKALRAQMNPHFIFNCMNTIDAYIFKEQPDKASSFLNRFSKLIRQTLENSQYPLISLDKELESLRIYITLEMERFENIFSVNYEIPGQILNNHYKIPPLVLQPYVENAIQHGLRHKKSGAGQLTISFSEKGNMIVLKITDNGIGRKVSQRIKESDGTLHHSMALELTNKRLEILRGGGTVTINDHPFAKETGTEVIINLPKIY
jgi:sensor histidine kinase YesM